jgi:4'-phosphopantetheinyl transferase
VIEDGQPEPCWSPAPGEMQLSGEAVHVWRLTIESLAGQVPQLAKLLSNNERSRANAFVHAKDRERFIISHGILRVLLGGYLEVAPGELQFSQGPYKKPCLDGHYAKNSLQFNLSHSQEYTLLAFTRQRQIGVDIEYMHPMPDMEQIAANTFSPHENRDLKNLSPQEKLAAFYTCWTRKEAFVKALGKGLFYPLNRFSVSIASEKRSCLLNIDNDPAEAARWTIVGLNIAEEYAAALAVEGHDWHLTIRSAA